MARSSGACVGAHGEMASPPSPSSLAHPNIFSLLVQWRYRSAPPRIGTGAQRRRAEEVGVAPSLTSHVGANDRLVLVESAMGSAARGSWWRRRWGGAPPADRPWSTPPFPCWWRRWRPLDLERWPRLGRSSDDHGDGSSPLASDRDRR
jgi:hypothetical protein